MLSHYDKDVNSITFDLSNYDGNTFDMFNDIARILRILTKNGEICTFYWEETDFYVLQHNPDNWELGDKMPIWVTPGDLEKLNGDDRE